MTQPGGAEGLWKEGAGSCLRPRPTPDSRQGLILAWGTPSLPYIGAWAGPRKWESPPPVGAQLSCGPNPSLAQGPNPGFTCGWTLPTEGPRTQPHTGGPILALPTWGNPAPHSHQAPTLPQLYMESPGLTPEGIPIPDLHTGP